MVMMMITMVVFQRSHTEVILDDTRPSVKSFSCTNKYDSQLVRSRNHRVLGIARHPKLGNVQTFFFGFR